VPSLWEDDEDIVRRTTSAERIEASLLGVTLYFADGRTVFLTKEAADAIGHIMYKVERKALDDLRAEASRTY